MKTSVILEKWTRKPMRLLKVGDTIQCWWYPGRDTITDIQPYNSKIFGDKKVKIASFALNKTGMTLEPNSTYLVLKLKS